MASDYKFICAGLNITKDATSNDTGFKSFRFSTRQHSFIHSGHFYSAPSSPLLLRGAPDYSTDTVSEFHAEATAGKGLAQGPYMAARAGVEPTTLRLKVIISILSPSSATLVNS